MRIGQFAVLNHTSIDTIRHYMSMGLLIPEKRKTQYDFDEKCTQDFLEISHLKKIGFTLSEIHQLILFRRMGKLTDYERRMTYTSFFEKKKEQIELEMNKLTIMKENLNNELNKMRLALEVEEAADEAVIGIHMSSLELFACPMCEASFEITEGNIVQGVLINATLTCSCHYQLHIEEGIIYTPEVIRSEHNQKEHGHTSQDNDDLIETYMNTTDIEYLKKLHIGLEWCFRQISSITFNDTIVLELGSGYGYFMRHTLDLFPQTSTYIAIDYDPVKIKWLKKIIERNHPKCNVIFICADFAQIPLKSDSVDMLLDIAGTSNYAFEYTDFLLKKIDHLVKKNAHICGGYIVFEKFVAQSKIPLPYRKNFEIQHIKAQLKALNYLCMEDFTPEPVDKGGPLEDYFVDGEKVGTYYYRGKKMI